MSQFTPDFTFEIGDIRNFSERISELNKDKVIVDPTYEDKTELLTTYPKLVNSVIPNYRFMGVFHASYGWRRRRCRISNFQYW